MYKQNKKTQIPDLNINSILHKQMSKQKSGFDKDRGFSTSNIFLVI